jgi:hypothetical protein
VTNFLRVLGETVEHKPQALLDAVSALKRAETSPRVFEREPGLFAGIPGSTFAYWASPNLLQTFVRLPSFASGREAQRALSTNDDFRYLRLWWERNQDSASCRPASGWLPFAKGGDRSLFYSDIWLLVNWVDEGREIEVDAIQKFPYLKGNASWVLHRECNYLKPGLTWTLRTTSGFGVRFLPKGCIFGHKGPAAFVEGDSTTELLSLAPLLNSSTFAYLLGVQLAAADAAARSYEVGVIERTPVPARSEAIVASLAPRGRRAWSLKRSLDTTNEASHAFVLPSGLNEQLTGLYRVVVERELDSIQRQIDDEAYRLYDISNEDRAAVEAVFESVAGSEEREDTGEDDAEDEHADSIDGGGIGSWLTGVAFGRFDPRLATGERAIPSEPEPFDPLPSRSPGMYPDGEEPADRPDILVDDEGHANDLAARAIAIAERVKVNVPENLRAWFAQGFFPLHIRMYSKSRRKAPIYWQLATASAGYSVWLYIHAFSKDTLFRVQNDYVAPKLAHEERRLESLSSELRDGATAAQRKQLAAQETFVEELRAFLDEVKRVAPLWNPNLDDGVIINFAPLWRLVPQNKAWQKELKATWDALCEGKYDWAHLAMHLWPERVVPKCAKDRSLAIAHGLEDVFWVEGTDGKWTARKTPTTSVDELVKERSSPAVKSALKSLQEAPAAAGKGAGRKAGGRRAANSTNGGDA